MLSHRSIPRLRHLPLYLQAIRVGLHAQKVRSDPLPDVIDRLGRLKRLPRAPSPAAAVWASSAASRHLGHFGCLDTCMTRALILGTLLGYRKEIRLHLGFRSDSNPRGNDRIVGHAWLETADAQYLREAGKHYTESRTFAMQRHR